MYSWVKNLSSATSSSTWTNANFLSLLLNVATRKFRISRGRHFLLDKNPKGYEVAEHISTNVKVNPQIISTLNNKKSIWSMSPGAKFVKSVVVPLGLWVALVRRRICQGYSKSGIFARRPSVSPFLVISFSLLIEKWPKLWWRSGERFCFESAQKVGITIFLSLWGLTLNIYIWR